MIAKKKALLVAPLIAIALFAAFLAFPSSGTPEPRLARSVTRETQVVSHGTQQTRLVLVAGAAGAAGAAAQWPGTHISTVRLRGPVAQVAIFYGTGETVYLEVGENIIEVRVAVNIATTYASSASEAMANTRVHVTISHPTAGTVFTGWLNEIEATPWTDFYNVSYDNTFDQHTLVAGTYTITTIYQVYA